MKKKMENEIKLQRGQVWYLRYNDSVGYEEAVGRPAVVVSSQEGLGTTPVIQLVYLTTTPRKISAAVELFTPRKRSWALCNQIVTIDRNRLTDLMCTLSESEMMKIDLALRKVLALPLKTSEFEDKMDVLSSELQETKDKVAELEIEITVHKRLYEKALDKIVELRFEQDIAKPKVVEPEVNPVMEKPIVEKVAPEIEVDVDALKKQMGAIPTKTKELELKEKRVRHGLNRQSKPEEFLPYVKPGKVNVNTYTWYEIVANTGIGIQTAQQIVAYRKKHGEYRDLVDLLNVPLFGSQSMNKYGNKLEV